jgi:hypothetical protein
VDTDGDEGLEGFARIVVIGGKNIFKNDILEKAEAFALGDLLPGEYPDVSGILAQMFPETLAGSLQNLWPDITGFIGRMRSEPLAGCFQNYWPDGAGLVIVPF